MNKTENNKEKINSEKEIQEQKQVQKEVEKSPEVKKTKRIRENKNKKTEKSHPLLTKVILRIVTILVLSLILFAVWNYAKYKFTKVETESKQTSIERQLSFCQELVSAKYRYSDIVSYKKTSGFAKSYSIIKYTGVIRAGLADITDVSYSMSADEKKIKLKVPQAEILGNELSSQEVFDEKSSIFVPITTQEIFDEIDQARRNTAEDMIAEGILDDARNYAIKIITQFLLAAGFEEVIVED